MNTYPPLEDVRRYAEMDDYRMVPVCTEILSDFITPIEALRVLKAVSRHCYLFESAKDKQQWGRWSFLGFNPVLELSCDNGAMCLHGQIDAEMQVTHPGDAIRKVLAAHKAPPISGMPPFTGGLVGYFSYDYIKYAEPTLKLTRPNETEAFKDVDLMLFDRVIAFDHFRQKLVLVVNMPLIGDLEAAYGDACAALSVLKRLLRKKVVAPRVPLTLESEFTPSFTKAAYCDMVQRAKEHIVAGDIFQVVLSNRMEARMSGSILDAYRILRTINPSPYMFYFSSDEIEIAGASPETLVKLENGALHTFPLAGTYPRGTTLEEDEENERLLLADEKERAEHNMLVDLGRNDIGKISEIGSVKVDRYMQIERFSHVMHIGSTVSGTLRADCDAVDAIDSILPAGTLSGAPKLRACEIIEELEGVQRGIYGGALGYMDFTGNLDVCIAIRLAYAKGGRIYVRSGAGIVADSVPEREYEECMSKAGAVMDAVRRASGRNDE